MYVFELAVSTTPEPRSPAASLNVSSPDLLISNSAEAAASAAAISAISVTYRLGFIVTIDHSTDSPSGSTAVKVPPPLHHHSQGTSRWTTH